MPSQPASVRAYSGRSERSRIRATTGAAARSAAVRPSAVSRSKRAIVGADGELEQRHPAGDQVAHRVVALGLPQLARVHAVGSTATKVWATNFWSSSNALSAAFCPAASPSKVKTTSPRNSFWSISSRRRILMCSSPNAVPHVATAVSTPARWQAITSV